MVRPFLFNDLDLSSYFKSQLSLELSVPRFVIKIRKSNLPRMSNIDFKFIFVVLSFNQIVRIDDLTFSFSSNQILPRRLSFSFQTRYTSSASSLNMRDLWMSTRQEYNTIDHRPRIIAITCKALFV